MARGLPPTQTVSMRGVQMEVVILMVAGAFAVILGMVIAILISE